MRPITRRAVLGGLLASPLLAACGRVRHQRRRGAGHRRLPLHPVHPGRGAAALRAGAAEQARGAGGVQPGRGRGVQHHDQVAGAGPQRAHRPHRRALQRPGPAGRRLRRRRRAPARARRHGGLPRRDPQADHARRPHAEVRSLDAGHVHHRRQQAGPAVAATGRRRPRAHLRPVPWPGRAPPRPRPGVRYSGSPQAPRASSTASSRATSSPASPVGRSRRSAAPTPRPPGRT